MTKQKKKISKLDFCTHFVPASATTNFYLRSYNLQRVQFIRKRVCRRIPVRAPRVFTILHTLERCDLILLYFRKEKKKETAAIDGGE